MGILVNNKRSVILLLALVASWCVPARADEIPIGFLSFDTFLAPASGPGVDAFDLFNFTGPDVGFFAGDPYASDSLMFEGATLTLTSDSGVVSTIDLGDIGPGE